MTFNEAAIAYELLQEGCTYRHVADQFGVSRTHLTRVIEQCLELGKQAPLVNVQKLGRPRHIPVEVIRKAMTMRDNNMSFRSIAVVLGVDEAKLRKSVWHFEV